MCLTLDQKHDLCSTPVTLNGVKAVIQGASQPFATVAALPDGESYQWAWPTVQHIITNRAGAFKS